MRRYAVVDDTLARKYGKHFDSLGVHHDPMSQNANSSLPLSHGHCFVCLALLAERCAGHFVALFVSCALSVQETVRLEQTRKKQTRKKQTHKQAADEDPAAEPVPAFATKLALAVGLVRPLVLPTGQVLVAVAEGAYAKREFVGPVFARGHHLLSRLRRDALFYDFPPEPGEDGKRKSGRPRKYEDKHKARAWRQDGSEPWQTLGLNLYGLYGKQAALSIKSRGVLLRRLGVSARLSSCFRPTRA
jgi:hypothetical protein